VGCGPHWWPNDGAAPCGRPVAGDNRTRKAFCSWPQAPNESSTKSRKKGPKNFRFNLKSTAPAADLAKLKEVVDAHCPVLDILRAPLPVDIRLKRSE
jgi:hypothetical protein